MPLDEATGRQPPPPWLEEFGRDPARTFDTMIRGAAFLSGLVDPVIFLPAVFGRMSADDPLRVRLDDEIWAWLEHNRLMSLEDRRRYGVRGYYSDVVNALEVVRLLRLSRTLANLREHYDDYRMWCSGEPISSALDPLARLWLALTAWQRDDHFRFLWHRLCRLTGEGSYPRRYLNIALMGLGGLPLVGGAPAALAEEVRGLAAWAACLPGHHQSEREARHDFLDEARAFRWRYPDLNSKSLRSLIEPVIRSQSYRDRPFAGWWAEEEHIALRARSTAGLRRPPPFEAVKAVIAGIEQDGVSPYVDEIKRLIAEHLAWAETTGESDFLVKTAGNIGGWVINEAPELTRGLAVKALAWAPNNEVLWNLWGRSLWALGELRLAEAVFWEAVRRFPDDEPGHVELARLLAAGGDRGAAIALLEAFLRRHSTEVVALNVLGLIYIDDGQLEAAAALLERLRGLDDNKEVAKLGAALARARAGEDVAMPAPDYGVGVSGGGGVGHNSGEGQGQAYGLLLTDARVTRADFILSDSFARCLPAQRCAEAAADLRALLEQEQPGHAYGWLVWLDRLGADGAVDAGTAMLANFMHNYVLRLMVALRHHDQTALVQLMIDAPERAAITALALTSLDVATPEQCGTAAKWLAGEAPAVGDHVAHYLHGAARGLLSGADAGRDGEAAAYGRVLESGRAAAEIFAALRRATRLADIDERLPVAA